MWMQPATSANSLGCTASSTSLVFSLTLWSQGCHTVAYLHSTSEDLLQKGDLGELVREVLFTKIAPSALILMQADSWP